MYTYISRVVYIHTNIFCTHTYITLSLYIHTCIFCALPTFFESRVSSSLWMWRLGRERLSETQRVLVIDVRLSGRWKQIYGWYGVFLIGWLDTWARSLLKKSPLKIVSV